ncbi:hypothetical protein Q644_20670 [Brucella intermedia 229E]|uniref:Uncharacterized protein n=1 Tax=Brucella intermedia 229E TaxID=1337887 RepID=U4VFU5_9HYPH|nr:hypothetical protein Q644_20670 [Brucella intermedia 229E]
MSEVLGFNGVVVTKSFALLLWIGLICYPQLAAASCTRAAGAADLMTQRQLSALRAMERSRGCKGGATNVEVSSIRVVILPSVLLKSSGNSRPVRFLLGRVPNSRLRRKLQK